MFHSATFRLTLSYLAIVMAISIIFSLVLYNVSAGEIDFGLHRQALHYQQSPAFGFSGGGIDFGQYADEQAAQELGDLQLRLALVNVAILLAGGALCYWLARRTLRPIEEALEAQSRFTADASHELRTPLTVMKSEIEVALRDTGLKAAEARQLLGSNLEEIGKLEALSNGLLRLAQSDGSPEDYQPQALSELVTAAVGRVTKAAADRDIRLESEVGPLLVQGDGQHLIELIVILLDNAIKYSPAGSRIQLKSRQHGKQAWLQVIDEGPGIKALDLPHIFDRFYRADVSRNKQAVEGYGLGLSIAKKIADQHGASIAVTSQPGKGTTFTVKMPLAPETP